MCLKYFQYPNQAQNILSIHKYCTHDLRPSTLTMKQVSETYAFACCLIEMGAYEIFKNQTRVSV